MTYRRQSGFFHFAEDPFGKNAQGIGKFLHEVLIMKLLKKKPQVESVNVIYNDKFYTVNKYSTEEGEN